MIERRRSLRAPLRAAVEFSRSDAHLQDLQLDGVARDISEGGMLIETDRPEPSGRPVILWVTLPGEKRELRLRAVVRWREESSMGVAFASLQSRDLRMITNYVAAASS
jgi:hypothetical protein